VFAKRDAGFLTGVDIWEKTLTFPQCSVEGCHILTPKDLGKQAGISGQGQAAAPTV